MSEVKNGISRRSVLKGAAVGGLGLAAGGSLLAGCGSDGTGALAFGARTVDAGPTSQLKALVAAYTAKTGNEVTYNATESNAFQNNLSQYLQGTPDDAFQWMAGYRMQFFAEQGLLVDLTDVWNEIGSQYADSYKTAATGLDGKQYFVPQSWYPWGMHFRKSMFADLGLSADTVTNWDEFLKMLDGMKKKGLVGFAAGDKGGWEAMGTFDILNARINGYQFHVDLLAGREKWTDAKVLEVFKYWEMLIPYMNPNVLDLEWDGAMQLLLQKKAGSMLMGSWFGGNFKEQSEADYADLSIIPFPEINPEHGRDTVDAPIDGFCVAANGANNAGGADFLKFAGDMEGVQAMLDAKDADGKSIPMTSANKGQDTSTYDAFQKEQLAVMDEAKYITQFLDRDTRPDFAGPVVGPAIQSWFKNPKDVNKIVDTLQAQWDALPPLA
ncbi:MAG: ABC transporter substrate-binding protein [Candidatus Planktophila sp.]|nr:ABC transporter substrate-binding protein [Candidatus Planktophila sp.]